MRFLIIILIPTSLCFATSSADGQTLHAILCADTDSNLEVAVRQDLNHLQFVLKQGLPEGRLSITELSGPGLTGAKITSTLRNLQIQKNDSVLFYYSGHGGYLPDRGHYLSLTNSRRLFRSEVITAITQPYTPKFWAVITDCCASVPNIAAQPILVPPKSTRLLSHLFLETEGRLDITSSRPEQVSLVLDQTRGSAFTWALCNVLNDNAGQQLDWNDVFHKVREETASMTEQTFANGTTHQHRGINQRTQTPYSFRPMYGRQVNGLRLGIDHNSLRITSIRSDLPAANSELRVGMRVRSVNGQKVVDDDHLVTAVNFSPRVADFEVEHKGHIRNLQVELAY